MTSYFRVGRKGKKWPQKSERYRTKYVGLGGGEGRKSSKIVGRQLWTFPTGAEKLNIYKKKQVLLLTWN